jgi:chemotaxis protein MotB
MKKSPVIVLSVLLAAALIFSILFYKRSEKTQAALTVSQEKLASMEGEISRLRDEKAAMSQQIKETEEQLGPLEQAERRVENLEKTLAAKDQTLLELKDKVLSLEGELQKETQEVQDLIAEGESKDRLAEALREKVAKASSHAEALKKMIEKTEAERTTQVMTLTRELDKARSGMASLEEKMGNVQAQREAEVTKLQEELEAAKKQVGSLRETVAALETARDAKVTGLQEELDRVRSEMASLKEKMAGCEALASSLETRLSNLKDQREALKTQLDELKSTHTAMVRDLQSEIQNREVTISALKEKLSISFVDRILFGFGKATITPQGEEVLAKVGTILKNVGAKRIRVIGNTDNRPIRRDYRYKFPSNWELSAARAAAVVRYFQNEIGLDPENLEAVGHSFYDPVASNETAEGRAKNRRVNIIIAPKLE